MNSSDTAAAAAARSSAASCTTANTASSATSTEPPPACGSTAAATLSDNDLLQLLAEIEAMALRHYPFAGAAQHDPRLPFALGRIAGIAAAAVRAATPQTEPGHVASPTCWCNPAQDQEVPTVWLHSDYQPSPNAVTQGEDAA